MVGTHVSDPTAVFRAARDFLLDCREDYGTASRDFRWPKLQTFNYATDWFDYLAGESPDSVALQFVHKDGAETFLSFAELSHRSQLFARYLSELGVAPGDRVLLLLGNDPALWVVMLACIRLGAVLIPATALLTPADLVDRITRGNVRAVIAGSADTAKFDEPTRGLVRISVGATEGWRTYDDGLSPSLSPLRGGGTAADDTLLLYFTSGTTALPKLVEHSHASYPVGHLSTMYWIGLLPGDRHLNVSSPGWAKHAWSSFFAPWNAGATVVVYDYERFDATALLDTLERVGVTTFCAPPTVWRMITQVAAASPRQFSLRECVAAGEPLNPEVITQIQRAWGLTVRDGYGQTETTAQIGNPPGQPVKLGSMGRPLPGYAIALVDLLTGDASDDGEICLDLARRPLALMTGYRGDAELQSRALTGSYYHTGDVASRDADGYLTYVGRADDVFKASDYRISPFELESVLIEHPAVAEAAVVPSPDPIRLAVPKAFVSLAAGHSASAELAEDILAFCRGRLAPYKRIRRLEFAELPKTISGKIRRIQLREGEARTLAAGDRAAHSYTEDDFPSLKR
jgi:acetyl-CoA synthetase